LDPLCAENAPSASGVRTGDLCRLVGQEKDAFKRNVRKHQKLALTESSETGCRLSLPGQTLLNKLR
jgi:hypothetical protein